MSIEALSAEAPTLIHAMLVEVAEQNGGAFADVQNDGVIDDKDMLTVDDVKEVYEKLEVNKAELLGLRLYTGKPIGILQLSQAQFEEPTLLHARQVRCSNSTILHSAHKAARFRGERDTQF